MNDFDGVEELRELMRAFERKLGVLDEIQTSCCGMTFAQCHAMVEIGRAEVTSLNDLAELLGLDKSTMSRTIDNLVNSEMVMREVDPEDRRYIRIILTAKGLRAYQGIEDRMKTYFLDVYQSIPETKRQQVIESIKLILQALTEHQCC